MTMLEGLQYVEDDLILEAEQVKPLRRRPLRKWGGLAACLALLAGIGLLVRPLLTPQPETGGEDRAALLRSIAAAQDTEGIHYALNVTYPPSPTEPPPQLEPPAKPSVFAWSDVVHPIYTGEAAEVILVGRALSEAELTACTPETPPGWAETFTGWASFRLADGSGGLSEVQLRVSHGERQIRIALREATEDRLAALDPEGTLPTMDGQGYRAWRQYYTQDGEEWVQVQTAFVKPPVLYTLDTAAPAAEEDAAALDLRDLLLAYARTPVPDLESLPPP